MTMLSVVPMKELSAMRTGVLDRSETCREVGSVLQGLELCLRIRIVIRDMWTAVSFCDVEIDEQLRDGFVAHAGAAVGADHRPGCGWLKGDTSCERSRDNCLHLARPMHEGFDFGGHGSSIAMSRRDVDALR
jgi:hypothetical protein